MHLLFTCILNVLISRIGHMDEDDEEVEPSEKLTGRKRNKGPDLGKVADDGRATKLKRKGRVTIEVKFITYFAFIC